MFEKKYVIGLYIFIDYLITVLVMSLKYADFKILKFFFMNRNMLNMFYCI